MGSSCSCLSTSAAAPPVHDIEAPTTTTTLVVTPALAPAPVASSSSVPAESTVASSTSETSLNLSQSTLSMTTVKIAVVYYSTYGHVRTMALKAAEAAKATGAEVTILQCAETLSEEVLAKMHAPPKAEHAVVDVHDLPNYDAFIFAAPTRFGGPCAQYKAMWDATGSLWGTGALQGKLATFITSTATQNGGQESTHIFQLNNFVHHGMIFVPIGYTNPAIFNLDEVHGSSPWGAGCLAGGDGSRQPSELELGLAAHQGKRIADFAAQFKRGKTAA